ncbi:MAG: hypothetical protein L6266_04155, partial [Nanoarchaeota archaeon]|nr:hypothetical protein [Nanoarchaeota archaeon]
FTKEEKDWTLEKIISNTPKETLILPGTFVWIYKEIKRAFRKTQLNFYNTAPIINNNRLQEYHKSRLNRESGEFGIADESKDQYKIFKPTAGVENGKIFNWRNLEIGLEICIDYGKGCLSSKNIHYLDLQLVIACGIPFYKENTAIKDKGYLIICDGHQGKYETERFDNRIYQRKEDNFNKIQPIQYTKHLDLYEI